MISPTVGSAAEMEAVEAICSLVSTSLAALPMASTTRSTAASMPFFRPHRVGAGGDVAQALAHERLGQDGGRGRAVARDVVGLLRDLLDELGADLLVGVLELDLLGDGDAVVGDRGGAPLLLEDDVAALRAEGDLDRVGELVHPALETAAGLFVKGDDLGHAVWVLPVGRAALQVPATDDRITGLTCSSWHSARRSATHRFSTLGMRVQGGRDGSDSRSALSSCGAPSLLAGVKVPPPAWH
jgi:hypothetical protein